jgi:hypothetical protein
MVEIGSGARHEVIEFYLKEPQALLICIRSDAPNAGQCTSGSHHHIICMEYRRGRLIRKGRHREERGDRGAGTADVEPDRRKFASVSHSLSASLGWAAASTGVDPVA